MLRVIALATLLAAQAAAPTFEALPVAPEKIDHPAINLRSHPIGMKYRTIIRQTVEDKGANLAGHFTVVEWGCGTSCMQFAIVNLQTGEISHNQGRMLPRGLEYRVDSALVVLNPFVPGELDSFPEIPTVYCRWDGSRLTKIAESSHAR